MCLEGFAQGPVLSLQLETIFDHVSSKELKAAFQFSVL